MQNLRKSVETFVSNYLDTDPGYVSAGALSGEFLDAQAETWPTMPDDLRLAAYMGVQQLIRPLLRRLDNVAEAIGNGQLPLDLPEEAYLQARYAIKVTDEGDPVYVRRDLMTFDQMEKLTARDRSLSAHFKRRADALEGWWYRTHDEQAQ